MNGVGRNIFGKKPFIGAMLRYIGDGTNSLHEYLDMSEHNSLAAETPRETFMEAAQREMIAFERKEREFRKQSKRERAAELRLPLAKNDQH